MKNKPAEEQARVSPNQIPLFDRGQATDFPKQLRVEYAFTKSNDVYIPKDKSVPPDSLIFLAWQTGEFTAGDNYLKLSKQLAGVMRCENSPFEVEGEVQVLSLLHLPGDTDCFPGII
jgi:hypothetical protein